MSELDLSKVGLHTARITIKETPTIGEPKKPVFVKIEGQQKSLKIWPDQADKFALKLEAGVEAEATIDVVERTHSQSGEKMIEAWLKSFGGDNKGKQKGGGGYGGGKSYTPKSDAEIHSTSIAGIVKSAIEFGEDTEGVEDLCDIGLRMYIKGLAMVSMGKVEAVPANPQQAEPADTDTLKAEANDYWKSINGTDADMASLKDACAKQNLKAFEVILECKKSNAKVDVILRKVGAVLNRGKAEPGHHRNQVSQTESGKSSEPKPETSESEEEGGEKDWYEEWRKISDAQGWPGFAEANAAWQVVLKKLFPGRAIKKADHLYTQDYYYLVQWGQKAVAGEVDIPAGFKAHAREAANA